MTEFTPLASFAGGLLIGLSAVVLMAFKGRIAGMTAIFAGILNPFDAASRWRLVFLAMAIVAPFAAVSLGAAFPYEVPVSMTSLLIGGVLVGIGVTYGAGCPSGHGVCGIARLSKRSIVATLVFMAMTALTVTLTRHVFTGGV